MNPTKKQIINLRKGKKRVGIDNWSSPSELQAKLGNKEYCLFWRTAIEETVYIDKENIITGEMSEKIFDTLDSANITKEL